MFEKSKGMATINKAMTGLTNLQATLKTGINQLDQEDKALKVKQVDIQNQRADLALSGEQAKEALANVQAILPKSLVQK